MSVTTLLAISLGAILTNNFIFAQFLGICPFLGVFIPLIVVNCIILGRAEGFASKNGVGASAVDGICQGIGYTLVLIVMCVFREFFGAGTFGGGLLGGGALGSAPGVEIFSAEYGVSVLTLPVGGFLTLGCLIAVMQWALAKSEKKKEAK